jgi:two-component system NarL family sensor kinase
MGARLTAIGYAVEAATRADREGAHRPEGAPDVGSALAAAQVDIIGSVTELRRIIDDLRPGSLDDLGLSEALTATTSRILDGAGIDASTAIAPEVAHAEPLDAATEAALYRIAVEAVTNVAHHSHATRCTVTLTCDDHDYLLTVEDNGIGTVGTAGMTDSAGYHRVGGIGVPSMQERARELGGTVQVAARPGGGTVVTALVPRTAEPAHG